ncbi:uncharacterized protein BKA78DRAFT_353229 [Phyllosticta capitalensis]|uniref:uncharacterized protein n=1 Tax=Phyllosticta capitalensis TaxID=121624 RepID=UPI00312FD7DA
MRDKIHHLVTNSGKGKNVSSPNINSNSLKSAQMSRISLKAIIIAKKLLADARRSCKKIPARLFKHHTKIANNGIVEPTYHSPQVKNSTTAEPKATLSDANSQALAQCYEMEEKLAEEVDAMLKEFYEGEHEYEYKYVDADEDEGEDKDEDKDENKDDNDTAELAGEEQYEDGKAGMEGGFDVKDFHGGWW